jgi:hypothetical protein
LLLNIRRIVRWGRGGGGGDFITQVLTPIF